MPELEIHHESEHEIDPMGQRVGVLAALLAVALAIVSIASHRTHTAAIIHKSNANDAWSYYQATRIKLHSLELGAKLAAVFGSNSEAVTKMLAKDEAEKKKYEERSAEIQKEAKEAEEATERDEHRALRYDLGEGMLEIALVLSSLYFISHKKMFPAMAILAGAAGLIVAATGLML